MRRHGFGSHVPARRCGPAQRLRHPTAPVALRRRRGAARIQSAGSACDPARALQQRNSKVQTCPPGAHITSSNRVRPSSVGATSAQTCTLRGRLSQRNKTCKASAMNERFENINLLRAYAAVSVVVYHVILYMKWEAFPTSGPLVGVPDRLDRRRPLLRDQRLCDHAKRACDVAPGPCRLPPGNTGASAVAGSCRSICLTCALWIVLFQPDFSDKPLACALADRRAPHVHAHVLVVYVRRNRRRQLDARYRNAVLSARGVADFADRAHARLAHLARLHPDRIVRGARSWCLLLPRSRAYAAVHDASMQLPGHSRRVRRRESSSRLVRSAVRAAQNRTAGCGRSARSSTGTSCMSTVFWSHSEYWDDPRMIIFWRSLLGVFLLCVRRRGGATCLRSSRSWPLRPVWYLGGSELRHLPLAHVRGQACLGVPDLDAAASARHHARPDGALAAASWHFFEKPILESGRRSHGSGRLATPACCRRYGGSWLTVPSRY